MKTRLGYSSSPSDLGLRPSPRAERGSTFIIVLWIAFGLVSLAVYFAQSMSFELRASDNAVCGRAAEQAIEGGARYVAAVLSGSSTNGVMPDPSTFLCEAVPVGEARFWLIGRETNEMMMPLPGQVSFGLVDEASKLNLNSATSNMLVYLPNMTLDLTQAILDWRDTNGGSGAFQTYYGMHNPPYQNKCAPFETVEELKLLYGADLYTLKGEDLNLNGTIDPDEVDEDRDGVVDAGILDYVTVYSREPNTYSNGTPRINIRNVGATGPVVDLLQSTLGAGRANEIIARLTGTGGGSGGRGGSGGGGGNAGPFASPLQFFRASGMTSDEFARIAGAITVSSNTNYIEGRVNINTASSLVLACLPGLSDNPDLAQTLVTYRQQNPDKLGSVAWLVDALGQNNSSTLTALEARDCITTESYQFTADIAAVGPFGRGYRRVRFVFDTADGTPRIVYRQDLTHLGWALGKDVRQNWLNRGLNGNSLQTSASLIRGQGRPLPNCGI